MKLPHRRQFLHLTAGAVALPAVSRIAWAEAYPPDRSASSPALLRAAAPTWLVDRSHATSTQNFNVLIWVTSLVLLALRFLVVFV
jgi:hypothetical protein